MVSARDREISEQADALFQAAILLGKIGRGQSQLPLLYKALTLKPSSAICRAGFSAAVRERQTGDARYFLDQIRPLLSTSRRDRDWLEQAEKRCKALPIEAGALQALLERRMPPDHEPVPGRICYVLHNALPFSSGGYATRAQGLAGGLQGVGHEVIILTRPGYPLDIITDLTPGDVPETQVIDDITHVRTLEPTRKTHSGQHYILTAAEALKARFREYRPALVIAASNHLTSLPAQIAARALGIPFIYEVRGFWEVTRLSRDPGYGATSLYAEQARLEALSALHADHVFTLTGPMKAELVSRGVPEGMISLLPNSCDPARFVPRGRDMALATRLGIPADVPVIGYIGSFVQYEGLDDLARACAILARRGLDFRLMLVGNENVSGTDKGPITAEIERVAAEEGLASRLIMPGRIPHGQVEAHYSLIDIAPFPRKPQPVTEMVSPMKPLEAYAMEKAVVASSVRALSEMVRDGETGLLFEKGDAASLAAALERLIRDPGLRKRLGKAGRQWVERERTWGKTAGKAKAVLDRFLA